MSWMLPTTKVLGMVLSPNDFTSLKVPLYISILLWVKSAAYKKFPDLWLEIARPKADALLLELLTAMMAVEGSLSDQPWMVPSPVSNKNRDTEPSILNSPDLLYTHPMGDPGPFP